MPTETRTPTLVDRTARTSDQGNVIATVPNGVVDGDLLLLDIRMKGNTATEITAPVGWTLTSDSSLYNRHLSYYRLASSEPSEYTWAYDSTDVASASTVAWRLPHGWTWDPPGVGFGEGLEPYYIPGGGGYGPGAYTSYAQTGVGGGNQAIDHPGGFVYNAWTYDVIDRIGITPAGHYRTYDADFTGVGSLESSDVEYGDDGTYIISTRYDHSYNLSGHLNAGETGDSFSANWRWYVNGSAHYGSPSWMAGNWERVFTWARWCYNTNGVYEAQPTQNLARRRRKAHILSMPHQLRGGKL